ncbi:MAG: N-acetylmuramoyl-L-alanine amidase [bacterium]|nr:N-acetylmuramoyl-L-alanine amidase [bacterium]
MKERYGVLLRTITAYFLFLLCIFNVVPVQAQPVSLPITVTLENGTRTENAKLYEINKEKYLDVADLADFLDADIKWLPVSKKVILSLKGVRIEFIYFGRTATINGQKIKMPSVCRLERGDLYVPLSFVTSRGFTKPVGLRIKWDAPAKILKVFQTPNILGVKTQQETGLSRLVLETQGKLYYESSQTAANKITIDIYKGVLDQDKKYAIPNNTLITGMNLVQKSNKVSWVIEACPEFTYSVKIDDNPWRILVDIKKTGEQVCPPEPELSASTQTVQVAAIKIPPVTPELSPPPVIVPEIKTKPEPERQKKSSAKIKTIVIDPGHGGRDPGAIGQYGTKEKDVNLKIAFNVAQLLHEKTNLQVLLTRKEDEFIPLAERTQIANDKKADLFVSIHCNSGLDRKASGFEIYFLSERATDMEAEAVANIENSVIDLEEKSEVTDKLKAILWSLTLNEFVNDSSELCSLVVNRVNEMDVDLLNRGVKQAGFYVLRGAKMPAILVECAFLSNKREERLLRKSAFLDKISKTIYQGIMDYIERKEQE